MPAPDAARPAGPPRPLAGRWWGKLLLVLLGTAMLTLAFAPFKQFYVAYVGLVPWLLVVRHSRGPWRAAAWSWVAAVALFSANWWWLWFITGPGVVALIAWCGLYWAAAGAVLWPAVRRGRMDGGGWKMEDGNDAALTPAPDASRPRPSSILHPPPSPTLLLTLPVVFVAAEWLRGTWPFQGMPWNYLSHTQTPVLAMCQIADVTGDLGVSFWVAMVNGLAALFIFNGWNLRGLARSAAVVAAITVAVAGYGAWRIAQTPGVVTPGPTVLVVQPNYPQDNTTGNKGAAVDEIIDFHVTRTESAITAAQRRGEQVDLVAWSETMMPPLNPEARASWASVAEQLRASLQADYDRRVAAQPPDRRARFERELRPKLEVRLAQLEDQLLLDHAHRTVARLARRHKVGMIVGTSFVRRFELGEDRILDTGRRNSAAFYQRDTGDPAGRFDKVHLVPFGEYIPFREAWPWLYRRLIALGPPNMESYQLERGERYEVFGLAKSRVAATTTPATTGPSAAAPADAWRFVTPICFEDTDGDVVAALFRGGAARGHLPAGGKAADLIVNLTNDGWFAGHMRHQHLQIATFRSIENRTPTARSANTGISGFIDSVGRTSADRLIASGTEGALAAAVMLDGRTTFFTAWGDLIGPACGIAVAVVVTGRVVRRARRRRHVIGSPDGTTAS